MMTKAQNIVLLEEKGKVTIEILLLAATIMEEISPLLEHNVISKELQASYIQDVKGYTDEELLNLLRNSHEIEWRMRPQFFKLALNRLFTKVLPVFE